LINIIFEKSKTALYQRFLRFIAYKKIRGRVIKNESDYETNTVSFLYKEHKINPIKKIVSSRYIADISKILAEFVIVYLCEAEIHRNNSANKIQTKESDKGVLKGVIQKILYGGINKSSKGWLGIIQKRIREHLSHSHNFTLSAFISFRAYDLREHVASVINEALALLNAEREYEEFISVMQFLVENSKPVIPCVHLYPHKENFELKDSNGNTIPYQKPQSLALQDNKSENSDDVLISTLIAVSPKEIYIHADNSFLTSDVFAIINNIFPERISLCYDDKPIR